MLTHEEKAAARMLGEAAATTVALDALENLYTSLQDDRDQGLTLVTIETYAAIEAARAVLTFAGRLDQD